MHYAGNRGFMIQYFQVKYMQTPAFPQEIEVESSKGNHLLLKTDELVIFNIRLKDLIDEVYLLSNS